MDPSPEVGKKIIEKPPSTAVDESGSDDETDTIEMEGRTVSAKGQQVYVFFFSLKKYICMAAVRVAPASAEFLTLPYMDEAGQIK